MFFVSFVLANIYFTKLEVDYSKIDTNISNS